ncbi:hypothetical protein E2C01_095592 [Portunus trituberculatus]|uniref:Uncharacterized protein n=1 Tax=Portunus trituberculatus TaxID=210409 RepID=A0A5B7K4K9_PORTR|nr:hypothetical protein [Portunus trituberculatus]
MADRQGPRGAEVQEIVEKLLKLQAEENKKKQRSCAYFSELCCSLQWKFNPSVSSSRIRCRNN